MCLRKRSRGIFHLELIKKCNLFRRNFRLLVVNFNLKTKCVGILIELWKNHYIMFENFRFWYLVSLDFGTWRLTLLRDFPHFFCFCRISWPIKNHQWFHRKYIDFKNRIKCGTLKSIFGKRPFQEFVRLLLKGRKSKWKCSYVYITTFSFAFSSFQQ